VHKFPLQTTKLNIFYTARTPDFDNVLALNYIRREKPEVEREKDQPTFPAE